jgi:signal transduction histidine kinase
VRLRLRWKILLFTVPPLVALTFGTLWMVNRSVSRKVQTTVRQDLTRASAVFEDMLAARTRELAVAGQVIVQDPRFFSVLTLANTEQDAQLKATVRGVAVEFNQITGSELFEVLDPRNRTLGSVGRVKVAAKSRAKLVKAALQGRPLTAVLIDSNRHYLVSVTPVSAGGRIVGVLLLGDGIGRELALKLRDLTHSEVTFLCGPAVSGTTLDSDVERATANAALERGRTPGRALPDAEHVFEVVGPRETYLTIAAPIPGSDPASGQMYVLQRSLDAETATLRHMQQSLLLLGLVAAVIALLAGLLVADTVTSPLRRLVRGAEEMERGNYDYDLRIKSRDEVGYLTARFLEMRKQQRTYVRSLEDVARFKSEFINLASHELRTPISIIRCYHELFEAGQLGPVTPQQKSALAAIDESLVRLSRLAENATIMAQIDSKRLVLTRSEQAMDELVENAVAIARAAGKDRAVEVVTNLAGDLGSAEVDGPQLAQAVTQLVMNGIRFTPDGGRVTVDASYDRRTDEYVIAVSDTGVGIAAERRARVFERAVTMGESINHHSSSTLDFNSAGLGLGLSSALGIVEAHGGTITLDSAVGRGSRFEIRVPARDEYLEAAA